MRIDAALADEAQPGQPLEERRADLRALPDQHQSFGRGEALRERVGILDVVVPDDDLMRSELAEALQGAHGVKVIVENRDLHGAPSSAIFLQVVYGAVAR